MTAWLLLALLALVLVMAIAPLRAAVGLIVTKVVGPTVWNLMLVTFKFMFMAVRVTLSSHMTLLRNLTRPKKTIYPSLDGDANP